MDHQKLLDAGAPKGDDGRLILHDCCEKPPLFGDERIECPDCGRFVAGGPPVSMLFAWNRDASPDECEMTGCPCLDPQRDRKALQKLGRDVPGYVLRLIPVGKR